MGENPKVAAAVYACGVFQFDWNGQEELLRQSNAKGTAAKEGGHDEGVKCIQPADVISDDVQGDVRDLGGSIMVTRKTTNRKLCPSNWRRANPKATKGPVTKTPIMAAEGHDRRVEEPHLRTDVAPEVCETDPVEWKGNPQRGPQFYLRAGLERLGEHPLSRRRDEYQYDTGYKTNADAM